MSSPVEVVSNSCSLISTLLSCSSNSVNTLPFKCVMNTEGIATSSEPLPLIERGCDKFCGISLLSVRPSSVANVDYITNNFHMCMRMCLYMYGHASTDTHAHRHKHTHTHTHSNRTPYKTKTQWTHTKETSYFTFHATDKNWCHFIMVFPILWSDKLYDTAAVVITSKVTNFWTNLLKDYAE